MYTQKAREEEKVEGKEESRDRNEDMGRHEHLLLKEIREMAVPLQPAVKMCCRCERGQVSL